MATETKPIQVAAKIEEPKDDQKDEQQHFQHHKPYLAPVITEDEIRHFQELGLGRGIDSTDENMWKNKSPIQIRTIAKDLNNVIGTNEMNTKQQYMKFVSSVKTQQAKIQASLTEPTSHVNIGLDAHYARTFSQTTQIQGTKIQTRTISFRYEFDDIPVESVADIHAASLIEPLRDDGFRTFEQNMAVWILAKLQEVQRSPDSKWTTPEIATLEGATAIDKLAIFAAFIGKYTDSPQALALGKVTRDIIFTFGITHYVSSIQLGALRYSVETSSTTTVEKGAGAKVAAGSAASASGSIDTTNTQTQRSKNEQTIGSFNDEGIVERDTLDEAVIGFQIEPLNKLIRIPAVALAVQVAISRYLQSKTDDSIGPLLISTTISKKFVFWKVDKDLGNLIGTEEPKEASLFYIIPTGDKFLPSDFTVAHWGDQKGDRRLITNIGDSLSRLRTKAPIIPRFLTTQTSLFGSNGPLHFKHALDMKDARFTIHWRIHSSFACFTCLAPPVGLQSWLEGDEFYVRHITGILERREFIAIQQGTHTLQPTYTSTILNSIEDPHKNSSGMLFRLHPYEFRERANTDTVSIDSDN